MNIENKPHAEYTAAELREIIELATCWACEDVLGKGWQVYKTTPRAIVCGECYTRITRSGK